MNIIFDESFEKSIKKVYDKALSAKLPLVIKQVEQTKKLSDIIQLKKLQGFKSYYRIRLGNYRLGIELVLDNTELFIIVAHRKDIYNKFP